MSRLIRAFFAWAQTPRTLSYLRIAVATWYIALVLGTPWRAAFLLTPGAIGNDVSNYLAAGERLNAGHPLYELSVGDRPVPTYPPFYTAPLVSPPPIAVAWRVLDLLPEPIAIYGWWLGGLVATSVATLWVVRRGRWAANALVVCLSPELAWTALSGNVNAYVVPALVAVWIWHQRFPLAAGALGGLAAIGRLTPIVFGLWGLTAAPARLAVGMATTLVAGVAVSLVGAGIANHVEWLEVARYTATTGASSGSVSGLLREQGADPSIARLGTAIVGLVLGCLVVALAKRPAASWVCAVVFTVVASPVVHQGSFALLLAVAAASIKPFPPAAVASPLPSAAWRRQKSSGAGRS